jgi:hypothetical protein
MSIPPPPSTRARLPVPVCSNTVILLALMMIVSSPTPALNNILKVLGNSGDEVIATGFDDSITEKTVDGVTYTVYAHSDANTAANALRLCLQLHC